MFNYIATIAEVPTVKQSNSLEKYKVNIPAICDEPIESYVLTLPGIRASYDVGDTVVVAEVEAEKVSYMILGILQKSQTASGKLQQLDVRTLNVLDGSISDTTVVRRHNSKVFTSAESQITLREIVADVNQLKKQVLEITPLIQVDT